MLTLGIIFYLATREHFRKIFKALLVGFTIIILPPILDIIYTFGEGARLTYLLPGIHHNLLLRFLTFGGHFSPITDIGITFGVRAEVLIALFFSFLYLLSKSKNILKSVVFTIFIYTAIFAYSVLPFFSKFFLNIFGLKFEYSSLLMVSTYLVFLPIQLGVIFYFLNRQYFIELLRDMRMFRAIHYELMFFAGIIFAKFYFGKTLNLSEHTIFSLIFIPIAIFFAGFFSLIHNNIQDSNIDRLSNPHISSVTRKSIPLSFYKKIAIVSLILSTIYSLTISLFTLFFILLFIACYWVYSMPPLRLKRIPFLSKEIIAFNSLILCTLGFGLADPNFSYIPWEVWLFFLAFFPLPLHFIDIKDYVGDKSQSIKTLPVILGLRKSKLIIGLFFLLSPFYLYFTFHNKALLIPGFIFGLIEFILINKKKYSDASVMFVYLLSFLALLFYLGSY